VQQPLSKGIEWKLAADLHPSRSELSSSSADWTAVRDCGVIRVDDGITQVKQLQQLCRYCEYAAGGGIAATSGTGGGKSGSRI
jgi:hypothetical protein